MECNKDEALRSRTIAEQKFLQNNLLGAKLLALKAQDLFPDLDDLPQLIVALDVHLAAQRMVDGIEKNWYAILQVDAMADEVKIRKQYRKLALTLHPDKNKAVGAESAFKLISEAWHVLSDKEKKAAYDIKMMANSSWPGNSATKPVQNFGNFAHFRRWIRVRPSDVKNSFWMGKEECVLEAQADRQRTAQLGSSFVFHWAKHQYAATKHTAAARAAAEMVHQTYEAVRRERVKAQEEARQEAAKERMEVEMEERRRKHRDRKHTSLGQSDMPFKVVPNKTAGNDEHNEAYWLVSDIHIKPASSDALGCLPTKRTEAGKSPCQELGSGIGEISSTWNRVCKPFMCRTSNIRDNTKSCDNTDNFSVLKRLKVDV